MAVFFEKACPVWLAGLETEMNITAGFYSAVEANGGELKLRAATSGAYRVFVNGRFAGYGPARCAHGFFRVDEILLPLTAGINHIAVEVIGYYMNGFAVIRQPSFVQLELSLNGAVVAATGGEGFVSYRLTERVRKLQRFTYQRPMSEGYRLTADSYGWREGRPGGNACPAAVAPTEEKQLIERGIATYSFPEVSAARVESRGEFITGVKPETYKKDRALTYMVGDPEKGMLSGWPEEELDWHLSDDVQEWQITVMQSVGAAYTGRTTLAAGAFEVLSMPIEKTGFIAMTIRCREAGTLYVAVDETHRQNGDVDPISMECVNAIRLDVQPGEYPFRSAEIFGFKYLKLACVSGAFEVADVRVSELICPQPVITEYTGSDPQLAAVFKAAVETFKQNSPDIFMDCPTRERAGWLCDSYFTAQTERVLTGDNVIERAFLQNFLLPSGFKDLPEGMIPMCYPADTLDHQFISNWALWFILELEDYVRRNGDRAFVLPFRERVYGILGWFEKYENADGLLDRLDNWVFVEWSRANQLVQDINFPSNMLYTRALRAVAALFDDPAKAEKADKLAATIRTRSFNGQFFTDNEVYQDGVPVSSGECTETCQYYAFFTGVATPETYPELWQRLLTDFGPDRVERGLWPEVWPSNMFIGNYLRLAVLARHGRHEQLLKECIGYFHYMAERTGTLWENITDYASCNHGFASYAAVLILEAEANT